MANPFRVCRKNTFGLIVKKFLALICPVTSFSTATNDFSFPVFCEFRFSRQTLQGSKFYSFLTQGCRWRSNPGLKLANAFGVILIKIQTEILLLSVGVDRNFHRPVGFSHSKSHHSRRST